MAKRLKCASFELLGLPIIIDARILFKGLTIIINGHNMLTGTGYFQIRHFNRQNILYELLTCCTKHSLCKHDQNIQNQHDLK